MKTWTINSHNKQKILALGGESDGNFSFYDNGKIYFSDGFGDLLDEKNFQKFQKAVLNFINKNGEPSVIVSDLHPLLYTTVWGKELAQRLEAEFVQVQHHLAHIYSAVGDYVIQGNKVPKSFIGIACDGTGYGLDEKIWGGEIFLIQNSKFKIQNKDSNAERIGKLENQILIGGELAIREPARMLISILGKFLEKDEVYKFVKKFYNKNEFELLWNQWKAGFNCIETSSTGRVLDAVSVLLGFSGNERAYKHAPIERLEKNSTKPCEIEPFLLSSRAEQSIAEGSLSNEGKGFLHSSLHEVGRNDKLIGLQTTPLFKFLVSNLDKDKKKLAATAQMYIAKGLWEIILCYSGLDPESIKKGLDSRLCGNDMLVFFAGGIANNKIISDYLVLKGVVVSKEIPRGDAGLSFGQLFYYLTNTRD
jgi:hydrogenase maturation protein HypF